MNSDPEEGASLHRIITAVSLNPAIDRTILVPGFKPRATNRALSTRTDPGGKGINVARVVRSLGGEVRVVGFLGRENRDIHARHLAELGIPCHCIAVPGETRVNIKIVDTTGGALTEINDRGFAVTAEHLDAMVAQVRSILAETAVLVLSGSLPAGAPDTVYRDLILLAREAGVPTILDADGAALAAALRARPTVIKPNQAEAERLLGRPLSSREALVEAARELRRMGAGVVVISCGAEGAVLAGPDGVWWATPPAIDPGSTVGAGDSMVGALALELARNAAPGEALRLATAAGAATAQREGTTLCTEADVTALLPRVMCEQLLQEG